MSEYTANYNLDLYSEGDRPNLCDQYNSAMNKVDSQLKVSEGNVNIAITNANNAVSSIEGVQGSIDTLTANTAKDVQTLTTSISDLTATVDSNHGEMVEQVADLQTSINATKTAVNELQGNFPVATANIADSAVTAAKLDSSAMNAILENFDIRYFNSADNGADNDGISVPSGGTLGGFYIVGMNILVISTLSWENCPGITANTVYFTLPAYIPKPTSRTTVNSSGILFYNGSATGADVRTFRGMSLNANGGLSFNSTLQQSGISIFGVSSTVVYCGSFGTTYSAAGNAYTQAVNANGAMA